MTSKDKQHGPVAHDLAGPRIMDRLKPDESAAVLRRLLEAHPDLASEAGQIVRSFLHEVNYERVAAEIEDEIRAQDNEALNARAGRHERGYVEPRGQLGKFSKKPRSHSTRRWR